MSSSAPSQPAKSEAYTKASNPITRNPAEKNAAAAAAAAASEHAGRSEARARDEALGRAPLPQSQSRTADGNSDYDDDDDDDAVPSSLGAGVRSSGPADETEARNTGYRPVGGGGGDATTKGPGNRNVDADQQLETLAEGKVADAVERKSGGQMAPGQSAGNVQFDDYTSGLERKKQEQRRAREDVKEARREGVDVDGGFGPPRRNEDNRDV